MDYDNDEDIDENLLPARLKGEHSKMDGNQTGHMDRLDRTDRASWPDIVDVTKEE